MIGFDLSALDGLEEDFSRRIDMIERFRGSASAQRALKTALDETIVFAARQRIRVRHPPSALKNAIEAKIRVDPVKETLAEVGVSYKRHKEARHAHLVEYGHGGPRGPAKPHPFMEPAVRTMSGDALDRLSEIAVDLFFKDWKKK